jgi:hypothetical protein
LDDAEEEQSAHYYERKTADECKRIVHELVYPNPRECSRPIFHRTPTESRLKEDKEETEENEERSCNRIHQASRCSTSHLVDSCPI